MTMRSNEPADPPLHERKVYRALTAAMGLLFLVLGGCVIFLASDTGWPALALGLVLAVIGGNALLAARKARPSWLARIGPLP